MDLTPVDVATLPPFTNNQPRCPECGARYPIRVHFDRGCNRVVGGRSLPPHLSEGTRVAGAVQRGLRACSLGLGSDASRQCVDVPTAALHQSDHRQEYGYSAPHRTQVSVIVHAVPPEPGTGQSSSTPFDPHPSPCIPSACFPQMDGAGHKDVFDLQPTHVCPICAASKHVSPAAHGLTLHASAHAPSGVQRPGRLPQSAST
jgi:hypothetical protein